MVQLLPLQSSVQMHTPGNLQVPPLSQPLRQLPKTPIQKKKYIIATYVRIHTFIIKYGST